MIACKYKYKGIDIGTIEDLYMYLDNNTKLYNSIEDIIFSAETRQSSQVNRMSEIKTEANENYAVISGYDEDAGIRGKDGAFSISEFMDNSGEAIINGNRICTPLNKDEYKLYKISEYLRKKGKSFELALQLADNELNSWNRIIEFSRSFHRIGISKYIGGSKDTELERKSLFIEQAKSIIGRRFKVSDEFLSKMFDLLTLFYLSTKRHFDESLCFRGINITSMLKNSSTKLFSHIDYAIIGKNGNLHIYNFKVSSQFFNEWSEKKKEKYDIELAFIKQMLADNGFDIKGITLHHIPVQIKFDENFSEILDGSIYIDGLKANSKYDLIAKFFIKPEKIYFDDPSSEDLKNNKKLFDAIFPSLLVSSSNIERSVNDWIKRAPAFGEEQPVTIREINDGEHRYVVTIEGKSHLISNYADKENNKEIKELIKKHIEKLNEDLPNSTNEIADAISHTFANNLTFFDFSKLYEGKSYLNVMLKKYIEYNTLDVNGNETIQYKWKFIDTLVDCGILLFVNKDTNQLDVVVLSSKNLNQTPKYDYGNNILGGYLTDRDFQWRGTYGNVETVRGLINVNTILLDPKLEGVLLGEIQVLSKQGMSYRYNIEHVVKDYMKDIFKTVKRKHPEVKFENNFGKAKFVDYYQNIVENFLSITSELNSSATVLKEIVGDKFEIKGNSNEEKRAAILSIMESIQELFPEIANNPLLVLKDSSEYQRKLARFYILLSQAYLYYSGEQLSYEDKLTNIDKYMYTAPTIPNSNIKIVTTNLLVAVDSISEECETEYSKNIRPILEEFYKDAGYTHLENFTLGTQNRLFSNLFETDSRGKKTFTFKNPYNDITLKDYERKFLKKVLFCFNKYRFKDSDNKHFTSPEDPEIPKYIQIHGEYLNVPLTRASKATRRLRLNIQDKIDNIKRIYKVIIKNGGKGIYDEFVSGLTEDEAEYYRSGIESMRFKNPFGRTQLQRQEYIEKNGENYFETNVENMLGEVLFNSVYTEKINRMLLGTKALLLQMSILGENSGTDETFKDELEFIKQYINLHVFKKPITDKGIAQKVVGVGMGVRKAVTFLNLAGNVIAAARDVENGFMENYIRTASKYMTDISASNLSKAYAFVVKEGSMDAMKMTLLSKLCTRYRLSNTDTSRIVERLKSGRQGLANWDNIAYSTLRAPDFLNRMSLFIGKAMQDGVLDAWEVKDGELIYNWRKDKRFNLLTNSANKNNPEYKKQKALYILAIKEWNKDHPDPKQLLTPDDDLPTPYSNQEILAIKQVADNIYGAYDKMTRGMGDFTATGMFFGMYTTWMNGIWNNWMMKPGKYNIRKMTIEQETNITGDLLFLDDNMNIYTEIINEDGTKKYINEDTGEEKTIEELNPILKHVPVPVQGVIYNLKDAAIILKNDGIDAALKYLHEDPNTWASVKLLLIKAALGALFAALFKFVLDPAYKETKKAYKDMSTINILLTELAYRPIHPATDSLYGILNVIEYLGENTDPPIYNVPTKLVSSAWKTVFGNKTTEQFISENFAFARIFKELAKVEAKR